MQDMLWIEAERVGFKGQVRVFAEHEPYRRYETVAKTDLEQFIADGWTPIKRKEGGLIEVTKAPIVYDCRQGNLILRQGRVDFLKNIFNANSPTWTAPVQYGFMGVGSGTSAAVVTNTGLGTELVAGTNRLTITNTSGNPFTNGDVIQSTSGSDDQIITVQAVWLSGDPNNGSSFAEYGVFSSATFAAGNCLARFVPSSAITKGSFSVTNQWSYRS